MDEFLVGVCLFIADEGVDLMLLFDADAIWFNSSVSDDGQCKVILNNQQSLNHQFLMLLLLRQC